MQDYTVVGRRWDSDSCRELAGIVLTVDILLEESYLLVYELLIHRWQHVGQRSSEYERRGWLAQFGTVDVTSYDKEPRVSDEIKIESPSLELL